MQSSIRSPDGLVTSDRKTRPLNVIGQCSDNVSVLPRVLERLVGSVAEAAGLERTTVATQRRGRGRRGRQVGAVRRRLGGVGERAGQVVHPGTWSEGGGTRGHVAQERGLVGPQRGGEGSAVC